MTDLSHGARKQELAWRTGLAASGHELVARQATLPHPLIGGRVDVPVGLLELLERGMLPRRRVA